jgi:hypothetical protein
MSSYDNGSKAVPNRKDHNNDRTGYIRQTATRATYNHMYDISMIAISNVHRQTNLLTGLQVVKVVRSYHRDAELLVLGSILGELEHCLEGFKSFRKNIPR